MLQMRLTALLSSALFLSLPALAQGAPTRITKHEIVLAIDPAKGTFQSEDRVFFTGQAPAQPAAVPGVDAEVTGTGEGMVAYRFRGTIQNPVKKSGAATWVAGDTTAGTISPEGSYLVRGFFAPSKDPCRFRITIRVPLPHRAVTVGRLVSEKGGRGHLRDRLPGRRPRRRHRPVGRGRAHHRWRLLPHLPL